MKQTHKSEWFLLVMAVAFFATGAAFYPHLPAEIASHWNAMGQVDGYMGRFWGVFLLPIIFAIVFAVLAAIPHIDPRRENIAKFRRYYDYFLVAFSVAFYYIYLLTLLWNIGYAFDLSAAIIPPGAALIYIGGMLLPRTEPNWFIGIRTPWTMSSPDVWHKTNGAGGWVFRACGLIILIGLFFPIATAIWFFVVPIIAAALGLTIYSYILYERERK